MQKPIPRDQLLSGQSLIRTFNREGIQRGLAALRTDNFRFTLTSQEFPGDWDKKEKWYGTDYKFEKIPREFMQELEATQHAPADQRPVELHLPAKNEFIPQRLDVEKKEVASPALSPKLIRNDSNVRVWFKKDDRFWVPKANVNLFLRTPLNNASPFTNVIMQLYKDLVEDSLIEYAYDAELAGLGYNIIGHVNAMEVNVTGYNDKMHVLLEKVLVSMRDLEVKQERFDIMKERLMRSYRNAEFMEPYRQVSSFSKWLNKSRAWANHELLEILPSITAEDIRSFYPQILRQMHIEMLAHGNLYKEDVLRIADLVDATLKPLPLPQSQWDTTRGIDYPPGCDFLFERKLANAENINHCIDYHIHLGDAQHRPLRAKLLLISHILQEPCFDTLRTKEQLGYIVSSGPVLNGNQAGFRVIIQSEKECPFLEKRIDAFLNAQAGAIKNMPQAEFEEHRVGVINQRLEKLKNLNQESGRLWHHVTSEMFDFESGKLVTFILV
jgi:insulysin